MDPAYDDGGRKEFLACATLGRGDSRLHYVVLIVILIAPLALSLLPTKYTLGLSRQRFRVDR